MSEWIIRIVLGVLLLFCGIQDLLYKRIYLWMIGVCAIMVIICLPFSERLSVTERLGGCALGFGVILLSKATGGKIGLGDGILLCVTGLGLGFWSNTELFGIALSLAAAVSAILLLLRIADRKKSIPFIPFLLAGYVILLAVSKGNVV